jgi:molecular chaperone GrpE
MVREAFWKGLQSVDLEIIPAEPGTPFDPNVHEGMAQGPHPEVAAGCIIEEISRGYRMGERVVRASKVVVSAGPPASEAPGGEESEEE